MKEDRGDLFFRGGFTLPHQYRTRATNRVLRRMAAQARLPFSGQHIVVTTNRALRRAQGIGILQGVSIHKPLVRSLIAQGFSVKEAKSITWDSMW